MAWVIDRFEGNYAVLENIDTLEITNIPRRELPSNAKECDVVVTDQTGGYEIDSAQTEKRKKRIGELMDKIKKINT